MLKQVLYLAVFLSMCAFPLKTFCTSTDYCTQSSTYGFFDFFSSKPTTSDLQKEIVVLKDEIDKLKEQQREILSSINSSRDNFASCKDEQKRRIESLTEFERIMTRYVNNQDGMNALHYAIKEGDLSAAELMLANGANIYTPCSGHTPLTRAAECNQLEIAYLLINAGVDVNHTLDQMGRYPIYFAAKFGSAELVNLLLDSGSSINFVSRKEKPSRYPISPLHIACESSNFEVVKTLIDRRARIDGFINLKEPENKYYNWEQGTPLDWAFCSLRVKDNPENLDLVKFLVENGATRRIIDMYKAGANRDCGAYPIIYQYLRDAGIQMH